MFAVVDAPHSSTQARGSEQSVSTQSVLKPTSDVLVVADNQKTRRDHRPA